MGIKMPSILRDAIDDMHCGITVSLQKYLGIHLEHEKTCYLQQMLILSPLHKTNHSDKSICDSLY